MYGAQGLAVYTADGDALYGFCRFYAEVVALDRALDVAVVAQDLVQVCRFFVGRDIELEGLGAVDVFVLDTSVVHYPVICAC